MHQFGQRLGQPVGQCPGQNGVIVVMGSLKATHDLVQAQPGRDGKHAYVIGQPAFGRSHVIGQ